MEIKDLLEDGFSEKYAKFYLDMIERERAYPGFDKDYREWAHGHGFFAQNAYAFGLNEKNLPDYLSNYAICKLWSLNDWERIWVNDKLTFRYILYGTAFDRFLPRCFFYSTKAGLRSLLDNPFHAGSDGGKAVPEAELPHLLREYGELAVKPNNSTGSSGFYHLSYDGNTGEYHINGKNCSEEGLSAFAREHPNYIFQEYLRPSMAFSGIDEKLTTMRIITVNERGDSPHIIGGGLRFPVPMSGEANYVNFGEGEVTEKDYNLICKLDFGTGVFSEARKVYMDHVEPCESHPVSGARIEGQIPGFSEVLSMCFGIARHLGLVEYMGFDICMTSQGPKCMEINTHPSIKHPQVIRPYLTDDFTRGYFERKLATLASG